MRRLPLFVWMKLVNSVMILFALPSLTAALVMLLIDRLLHARFFDAAQGGSPLLWQHYFWIFGHPEVYIMVLPAFGMISEIIPVFSRKPIFGYPFVAASTVAIAFLSYGVWAHHMFAVAVGTHLPLRLRRRQHADRGAHRGEDLQLDGDDVGRVDPLHHGDDVRRRVSARVHDRRLERHGLRRRARRLATDRHLFRGGAYSLRADWRNGVCAVCGHLLLVPEDDRKADGRDDGEVSFLVRDRRFQYDVFRPAFPRVCWGCRGACTPMRTLPWWGPLNLISTIGAGILVFGVLIFCANLLVSLQFGKAAGDDPWNAWTLEWASTEAVPVVVKSRRPLWDLKHPEAPDWVHE